MKTLKIADHLVGKLKKLENRRWAIIYPNDETVDEITSGDSIYLEMPGDGRALGRTRIETKWIGGRMEYYSVDGAELREGLRVARAQSLII